MPTEETKKALETFLNSPDAEIIIVPEQTPEQPVVAIEQTSASPDGVAITVKQPIVAPVDLIVDLLAHLKRIGMSAKDLHYRATGKPFYGEHLLADLSYGIEANTDDLIEVYFLGATGLTPPRMTDIYSKACAIRVGYPMNNSYFEGGLFNICLKTARLVEQIKKDCPDLVAGVHAILDKISQECYTAIGLLDQTLKGPQN